MEKLSKNELRIFVFLVIFLIGITFLTKFEGGADTFDYADTAKFFAGKYDAKIRTSHSYLYGLIHTPFVWLFESFWIFKITSLLSLFLIVYSVYIISGRDKKSLWLITLSPIVWYMAPWISPIQLASLLFLWGFYFLKKYDKDNKLKNLLYSGLLIGISWAFWDAVLFFIPLLIISFFYDKNLLQVIYYFLFILAGVFPRLILDNVLFGFAFFTVVRHIFASFALTFLGGFYEQGGLLGISNFVFLIIFFPIFTYLLFKRKIFLENKKPAIFIFLSIFLLIINSQIRFVLLIVPVIILSISRYLEKKKYMIQLSASLVLILLVLNPYILQIEGNIGENDKGIEFSSFIRGLNNISLEDKFGKDTIKFDLDNIVKDYPNESFVVGNSPDNYRVLAKLYWGSDVHEFVSIEDYQLNLSEGNVAQREICTHVKIKERRDFCFSAKIRKAFNDDTNYSEIKYGISLENDFGLEGFSQIKKYKKLTLWEKINNSFNH